MLTRLVVIIIIAGIVYIGFEWGVVYTINHDIDRKEENYKELTDEIEWWQKQTHEALKETNDRKRKFNDMQCKYNKERNRAFEIEQNFEAYIKGNKKKFVPIGKKNEEIIRILYEEGLSHRKIAEKIGCGRSTVQRAVQSMGLKR